MTNSRRTPAWIDPEENNEMLCPSCGATELIPDTRDIPYNYKGKSVTIPAIEGDYCPACGEGVLNREHGDRYGDLIGLFQREVNSA